MGDIADSLIDGEFDYITGEYIGEGVGYPRTLHGKRHKPRFVKDTPEEAKVRAIRKELAILIKEKQSKCNDEKCKNRAVNDARAEINAKYGSGWRNN